MTSAYLQHEPSRSSWEQFEGGEPLFRSPSVRNSDNSTFLAAPIAPYASLFIAANTGTSRTSTFSPAESQGPDDSVYKGTRERPNTQTTLSDGDLRVIDLQRRMAWLEDLIVVGAPPPDYDEGERSGRSNSGHDSLAVTDWQSTTEGVI